MKYIIETNADNGDSFYSEEFDTLEKAIEEMAYQWRLLPAYTRSELRRRAYLTKGVPLPYMIILGGKAEETGGTITYTDYAYSMTLREMLEAKEEEDGDE